MFDNSFYEALPFIIFLIAVYGILGICGLVSYILRGIGILRLSASRGLQNGWLGFIPIGAEYQLGRISGEIEVGNKKMKNPGLWMALLPAIVYGVFFTVYFIVVFSMVGIISASSYNSYHEPNLSLAMAPLTLFIVFYLLILAGSIFIAIIKLLALHRIFSCHFEGQRPVFYIILCAFVPLAESILLFNLGKKPIIYPPAYMSDYAYYPQQSYYPQQPYVPQQPQQQYPPYPKQTQNNESPAESQPKAEIETEDHKDPK